MSIESLLLFYYYYYNQKIKLSWRYFDYIFIRIEVAIRSFLWSWAERDENDKAGQRVHSSKYFSEVFEFRLRFEARFSINIADVSSNIPSENMPAKWQHYLANSRISCETFWLLFLAALKCYRIYYLLDEKIIIMKIYILLNEISCFFLLKGVLRVSTSRI